MPSLLEFRRVLLDRKSTRLNSSHTINSHAVFCLKKNAAVRITLGRQRPSTLVQALERDLLRLQGRCGGKGLCQGVVGFFFFNDTATTEIYTLSLHDALPICARLGAGGLFQPVRSRPWPRSNRL